MPETDTFKPPAPKQDAIHDKTPRNCEICGKECTGAGGLGAHMTTHYRKGEAEPTKIGNNAKMLCPHCSQWISKAYFKPHVARKHPELLRKTRVPALLERPKRVQIEHLGAREVCRVVLEQALSDGKINLDALDAYEKWVQDTEKFLAVLYR